MKKIENLKEFCEDTENYKLSITPYEFHLIKVALIYYECELEDWESTPYTQKRISEVQNLRELITELPF